MTGGSRLLRVLYFDDQRDDREANAKRLSSTSRLTVEAVAPPANLDLSKWVSRRPAVFLVDYELGSLDPHSDPVNYKGGTLAAALRERARDTPIILLTRRNLEQWQDDQKLMDALQVFDGVVFKTDVAASPGNAAKHIEMVARGFSALRRARSRTFSSLCRILGANLDETRALTEAGPPLEDGAWEVPQAARWIRSTVVGYPGILYDRRHAAATLGIDLAAFEDARLRRFLKSAEYAGPLALESRWWKARLLTQASSIAIKAGIGGPTHETFGAAWQKVRGDALSVADCNAGDGGPADRVCFVLRQPVHTEHSVSYFPDQRPAIMDAARVSFKAIRESNDVVDAFLDPGAREIVRALRDEG